MRFNLTVQMDNAAFDPEPLDEVARILRAIADRIENGAPQHDSPYGARDANGNRVGEWIVTDD